jgi:hypothetical protein
MGEREIVRKKEVTKKALVIVQTLSLEVIFGLTYKTHLLYIY